jgi:PmbA protein
VDEQELLELCDHLVAAARRSGADQAEAAASWVRRAETALENDDVHTVHTADETTFGLRVFREGALGFVTANRTDEDAVAAAAAEACGQARAMPKDPWNALPEVQAAEPILGLWDERITTIGVAETTERALRLLERVKSADARVKIDSGSVSASTHRSALVSSVGTRFVESATGLDASLFGMAVEGETVASFDYDGDSARAYEGFDRLCDALADRFVEKCVFGLSTEAGRSYKGLVLLSPEVVAEFLLPSLCSALAADAVRKGRSPLAGKLHSPIASTAFTLVDDPTRPVATGSTAADREGVPTRRVALIEGGTLLSFLFNHYEALAAGHGARSTGHASGSAGSLPGISPHQLELAAGARGVASLCDAGGAPLLWVGRFSGSTNPVTGDFSGVAKNSALVVHGERRAVRETAIAGNLYDLLRGVVDVSAERRVLGGAHRIPFVLADGVSVTSG